MRYLLAILILAACGKDTKVCTYSLQDHYVLSFGTLEEVKCNKEKGEVLTSAETKYLPGGIPTHVEAKCAKVVLDCK